ncbi:MAG TPA: oxidoreductase, partial [Clostridiales bacterium]|nr:oxidoreductase [Clostridiales bacterium]
PSGVLTAVADINPARLQFMRETYGDSVACFASGTKLMDSGLVDAIIIATRHYDHPPLAIEAFQRKLHVLSEKPAGVYTKQVRKMNAAADKAGVVFALMFNQRTLAAYRWIKEVIDSGKYGRIRRSVWHITKWYRSQGYYNSGAWRATWAGEGGGVLLNQCPHNLDLWQWICGMPAKIQAHCHVGKWHDVEIEDDVTAYMEYENGATGTFITSTGDCPGTNRLEIVLDGATIVCEDYKKVTVYELEISEPEFAKLSIQANSANFGQPKYKTIIPDLPGTNFPHSIVMETFASAILNSTPLVADGREGINSLTLSNAMYLSSWLNQEIALPLDEDM